MKKKHVILCTLTALTLCCTGCADSNKPDVQNPVTLTMWHVYGSQTTSPLNSAVDEFNNTVGKENGVIINIVSVTSSSAIDKALSASANHEPGAEQLPDLFTAYPRVAEIVGTENLLCWNDYFSATELSSFYQEFLAEGYFDDRLLMLPIAKSTEAFYLNQTLFDKFVYDISAEYVITLESLKTFDSIFSISNLYYDWSQGQNFLQINDFYNYAYTGMKTYNDELIVNGKLQLNQPAFEKIWTPLAQSAIYGGICLEDGYAASRWKTVEIISNTGSTADVLYQPDVVVYPDNTTENITALALPYPSFDGDSFKAVHRGGGLFALKNDDERKNYAAYLFAKWITDSEHNLNFVTETGYLPVTNEAFQTLWENITMVKNKNYHSLYQSVGTMLKDYEFFSLPVYENASNVQLAFEQNVKKVLKSAHNQYLERMKNGEDSQIVLTELVYSSLAELKNLSDIY